MVTVPAGGAPRAAFTDTFYLPPAVTPAFSSRPEKGR
jgi:hypothetical protein